MHQLKTNTVAVSHLMCNCALDINPLTTIAISKLLKMIGRSAYFPRLFNRDRSPHGHETDYWHGRSSELCEKIDACMPVCLLRAGQPRRMGDAAKSGQFRGQFSWDKYVKQVERISCFANKLLDNIFTTTPRFFKLSKL